MKSDNGPTVSRRSALPLRYLCATLALLFSLGQMWADTYTLVTNVSQVTTGDKVIVATNVNDAPSSGVTGWNGTKDATVSDTEAEWVQYEVTAVSGGWNLYDPAAGKYIKSPGSSNQFLYDATSKGTCSVNTNGVLTCNSRYLCKNGSYYRMYTSVGSYPAYCVWKVTAGGGTKTLTAVDITTTTLTKTLYETIDHLDLTGLEVTGTYNDASTETITTGITWEVRTNALSGESFTPEAYVLTVGQSSVFVRATVNSISSPWTEVSGLTVSEHTVTPGEQTINLNNALYGISTGNNAVEQTVTKNDITIVSGCLSSASSKTYYDTGHIRYYASSYLNLSVPSGYVITEVVFTASGTWNGSITASVGTYDNSSKTWSGSSQNVEFSFAAQNRAASIKVTFEVAGAAPGCTAPSITTQPVGATYMQNDVADALTVSVDACDNISGTLSYQWYSNTTASNDGGTLISGAEDASYTPPTDVAGVFYYYCYIMQGTDAGVVSDVVAVSVEGPEVGVSFEQELSAYTDWTFSNIVSQQTTQITAQGKTHYGTTGGKTTASMVTAAKIAGPDELTFYVSKTSSNNTSTTWYVRVSSDNSTWTTVTSQSAATMSQGQWIEVSADLSAYTNVYVGIFYEGGTSTAVRAIDDVILTTRSLVASQITYNATPNHGLVSVEKDGVELASGGSANEGDVLDVILAADDGYIGTVTVTKTVGGNDVTDDVYDAATGKLTMPAYAITITATFVIGVEAPEFDPAEGTFNSYQLVVLSTATTGASIYYTMTTDGSNPANPTSASTLYDENEGITLDARGTYKIKAIAYKDENHSTVSSATYTINPPFASVTELFTYLDANSLTTLSDVTVTGVVSKIVTAYNGTRVSFNISDDGQQTEGNQLQAYRNEGPYADVVAVGDRVTLHGNYKVYNTTTRELDAGNTIEVYTAKVLSSVTVGGTAVKTEYSANETFDYDGLTATAHYSNTGYSALIPNADITWANDLTDDKVTASTTVHVTATYSGMTSAAYEVAVTVSAKELVSIALGQNAYTVYKGQALPLPAVTATYSEGDPADVSAEALYDTENTYDNTVADTYTITVSYTFGGETKTATYTVTVNEYANADDAPYTVTEALAIITTAIGTTNSADDMVVAGTVSEEKIGNTNGRYKISDGVNELLVYNGKGFNNANFTATNYPKVGDEVIVKGKVVNYNGNTPEFVTGQSYLLSQIRPATLAVENVTAFEVGTADMAEEDLTINRNGSDGAITFTSGDEAVVTIVEGKLHAVAEGTATITANMAATANDAALNYSAATTTFDVTVVGVQPRYTVTFDANGGSGTAPVVADKLEGDVFALPANTFTKTGNQFAGWNDGTSTFAVGDSYTMPAADVTFTAQWAAVCPWADVYTSNVVFEGAGDSFEAGSKVKIAGVDYDAQKVGSSGKSGSVVVTVPAGAHTLHFHAVSWNSADITIEVAAEGVTNMSENSFDIKKDAGVKNSGTYTLANDPIDQHFHFTFDDLAAETQFTFSKTSGGDYRFVMYGINQEGGPELKSLTIGGAATKTEYEVGQSFSTDGLTVTAVYAVGGVDQEPVDVTDRVVWSIDPTEFTLTSQTSVTVTASLETKTTTTTIPVTVSETSTPGVTHTAIVVKKGDTYYAMGQNLSSGALNAVELEGVINGKIVNVDVDDRAAITWEVTITADGATYKAQNGKYLKGNGSNTTLSWSDEPFYWTWNDKYGCYAVGQGDSRSFYMYGSNTSDFKNYALINISNNVSLCSSMAMEINEYVMIDLTDKEFVTLREGLEAGKLGTICWETDIYELDGAVFYEPEMKLEDGVRFIESVKEGGVYPKGKPYLFQAEGEVIRALVGKTAADVAGTNNGMHGTFEDILNITDPDKLIVYENKLRPTVNNNVRAHRAYLVKSELPGTPNPAPNRRRLVMGRYDAPTAVETIEMDSDSTRKVLIDGQIYIVRDGKWYDVTGQQVR